MSKIYSGWFIRIYSGDCIYRFFNEGRGRWICGNKEKICIEKYCPLRSN